MTLGGVWSVFRFEVQRSLNLWQALRIAALASFPAFIAVLIRIQLDADAGGWLHASIFGLTGTVMLLGLLFWATPVVSHEIEARTWSYLAVRSCGLGSILVGKYLTAVLWAVLTGWAALTLACLLSFPSNLARFWLVLAFLIVPAAFGFGALFVLIGILIPKRAMPTAVAYTMLVEVLATWAPATINQFTLHFHLRSLLLTWLPFISPGNFAAAQGDSIWQHLAILGVAPILLLLPAWYLLSKRELSKPDENQ